LEEDGDASSISVIVRKLVDDVVSRALAQVQGLPAAEAEKPLTVPGSALTVPPSLERAPSDRSLRDPRYGHVYRKDAFLVLR
jgi:hypothetical protein